MAPTYYWIKTTHFGQTYLSIVNEQNLDSLETIEALLDEDLIEVTVLGLVAEDEEISYYNLLSLYRDLGLIGATDMKLPLGSKPYTK